MTTETQDIDSEREWLQSVYRGGERQLTVRAVVSGMAIGAIMCLSNLYVVLKTGWSIGVTITACILGFGLFRALHAIGLSKSRLSILENNAVGSVASAAGYMTGGGNMAALPALVMLTGGRPSPWALFFWFAVIAAMGVFAAIPIKRQLINREKLPFPTGTAAAETLLSMHAEGATNDKARTLAWSGLGGSVLAWVRDAKASFMPMNLPASFPLPFSYAGYSAGKWTLAFDASLVLVGAGALMGFKTGWSMLLGAALTYGYLAPKMVNEGVIHAVTYKGIMQFSLWPGAAMLLSSGLLSFAFQWRSILASQRRKRTKRLIQLRQSSALIGGFLQDLRRSLLSLLRSWQYYSAFPSGRVWWPFRFHLSWGLSRHA
jgi:putative OPT family oligopeptide transporter